MTDGDDTDGDDDEDEGSDDAGSDDADEGDDDSSDDNDDGSDDSHDDSNSCECWCAHPPQDAFDHAEDGWDNTSDTVEEYTPSWIPKMPW